jgi:hypothetical protein
MKSNRVTLLLLSVSLTSALFANQAQASGPTGTIADFGNAVSSAGEARIITLSPSTKYVNVTNGETVRFVAGDTSFTWNFSIFPNLNSFKLSRMAPEGMNVDMVTVYVAPNPLDIG